MYLIGAPGVLAVLRTVGPEPLGCGLAVLAIARWKTHRWQAVACFTLAVLCRETFLLVPLVLAVHGLVSERRLRPQLPLLVPPAVLAAWIGFMRLRTGAWPTEASDGRVGMGFSGLVEAADALDPSDIAALLLFAAIAVAVVVRARTTVAGGIVLAHVLLASVLGEAVWLRWNDFGRVLLPLVVFGLLALAPGTVEVPADERSERPDGVPVHPGELLGAPVR
jgi:ABC-type arginine/histidine transport system permease subunit